MVLFIPNTGKFGLGYSGKLRKTPRKLAQRSHLAIEFPQAKGRVIRTYIPFLENANISEKGKANLNSYNLVGRAGQLFSYGGADSRSLSVTFQITLVHLLEMEEELDEKFKQLFKVFFSERNAAKSAFSLRDEMIDDGMEGLFVGPGGFVPQVDVDAVTDAANDALQESFTDDLNVREGQEYSHAGIHRGHYRDLVGALSQGQIALDDAEDFFNIGGLSDFLRGATRSDNITNTNKNIDLFIFYINLIRASVLNNSTNSLYGPPIVRLSHGTMYNNVPCLLRSYNINIDNEAGYDVQTMTPKRVSITLDLVESRAGNFGNFKARDTFDGDNLAGWEAVIETNNLDPYNGLVVGGEIGEEISERARGGGSFVNRSGRAGR